MYTGGRSTFWLTRGLFLRVVGAIYFVAFFSLSNQLIPLFGADGLLPAKQWLTDLSHSSGFLELPSIFWIDASDGFMRIAAYLGVILSLLVVGGCAHTAVLFALWFIYMSFVHIGQIFYGFGWEMLLLETGFL